MAIIDTSVTNDMLDKAIGDATNGLVKVKLVFSAGSSVTEFKTVSWGTASSGEIDISSDVQFTINAGSTITGVYLYHNDETTPGILYSFESTYNYPSDGAGGTFTIKTFPITVS